MGRNDWQKALDQDDLSIVSAPRRSGRGWRVLSVLLLLAIGGFTAAYYVPLYRAHTLLNDQYRKLASEAGTQRKQLTETVQTLKLVSAERDKLAELARKEEKNVEAGGLRATRLEASLQSAMKKFLGTGKVQVSRKDAAVSITLGTPGVFGQQNADITPFGKKALCALAEPMKSGGSQILVTGYGVDAEPDGDFSFAIAATRAFGITEQLSANCGIDAKLIRIQFNKRGALPTLGAEILVTFGN